MECVNYIEDKVLCEYIWKHYWELMSPLEKRGGKLINNGIFEPDSPQDKKAVQLFGQVDLDELKRALADGEDVFRMRTVKRVIAKYRKQIIIARCPKCERVIRTPTAKQCLWCGHDWH